MGCDAKHFERRRFFRKPGHRVQLCFASCSATDPHRLICAYTRENTEMAQAPTFDTEINKAPALHISHIVRGRVNDSGRVRYLIDPEGNGEDRAIPEDVVLIRWRKRVMPNQTFHGCRLGPNLWRGVDRALGRNAEIICGLENEAIAKAREQLNAGRQEHHLYLPETSTIKDLFAFLGPTRLQSILDRHLDERRADKFGTPDLFLFARNSSTLKPSFYRLVEVKKPSEHIRRDQHEEIAFLRSIGVPARLLRLIER